MDEMYRPTREERKNELEELQGPVGIRRGQQVKNDVFDQQIIMRLLNKIPVAQGGTLHPSGPIRFKAPREGYCDPSLGSLILKFQQAHPHLTADGAVDPNGPTYKAMRTLSVGGTLAVSVGAAQSEQQAVNAIFALADAARDFVRQPDLSPAYRARLQAALTHLEVQLRASGAKRTSAPDARSAVGVAVAFGAFVIAAYAVMMLAVTPAWQKAATRYVQGLGEAAVSVAKFAVDTYLLRMQQAAKLIMAIDAKIEELSTEHAGCGHQHRQYKIARSSALEKIARYKALPGVRFTRGDIEILDHAITEFMNTAWELLKCWGGSDFAKTIMMAFSGAGGVIRFVIESVTTNRKWTFPFPLP